LPIFIEKHNIVVPGTLLAKGDYRSLRGTFREGDEIFSSVVGLADTRGQSISVVPLQGGYYPAEEDVVIGVVKGIGLTSWHIDIRAPYDGILSVSNFLERDRDRRFSAREEDLSKFLAMGDALFAKIVVFDRTRDPLLSTHDRGLGKLHGGRLIEILPSKVPRIIGRKGSMINMLKRETKTRILVGQNGRIWIHGKDFEDEFLVALAVRKIEREAHTSGLTDRVTELIQEEKEKLKERSQENDA
jgi:exosome complex component RRP4